MRERIYSMSVSKKRSYAHTLENKMKSYQRQSKEGKTNKSKRKGGAKAGPQGASFSASAEGGESEEELLVFRANMLQRDFISCCTVQTIQIPLISRQMSLRGGCYISGI